MSSSPNLGATISVALYKQSAVPVQGDNGEGDSRDEAPSPLEHLLSSDGDRAM